MRPFEYIRPTSLRDALAILSAHGSDARALAGGTDLLVQMEKRGLAPKVVVDIKALHELAPRLETSPAGLRIGAGTTMAQLVSDKDVKHHLPALAEAARVVGSVQIRSRATLAGNLANASPAADTVPALLMYGASVNIAGPAGERPIPLVDFLVGPGQTQLSGGELITSIDVAMPDRRDAGSAFLRLTRRKGIDLAIVSVACLATRDGFYRVACGAASPVPFVVETADRRAVMDQVLFFARPISDIRGSRDYRIGMLQVLVRRALEIAERRCA